MTNLGDATLMLIPRSASDCSTSVYLMCWCRIGVVSLQGNKRDHALQRVSAFVATERTARTMARTAANVNDEGQFGGRQRAHAAAKGQQQGIRRLLAVAVAVVAMRTQKAPAKRFRHALVRPSEHVAAQGCG